MIIERRGRHTESVTTDHLVVLGSKVDLDGTVRICSDMFTDGKAK